MVNLCNGIVSPRDHFSHEKILAIKKMIPNVRDRLLNEFGDLDHDRMIYAGMRFKNDDEVIARLESVVSPQIIKDIGWEQAIRGALVDCMMADYWYEFEKDYNDIG